MLLIRFDLAIFSPRLNPNGYRDWYHSPESATTWTITARLSLQSRIYFQISPLLPEKERDTFSFPASFSTPLFTDCVWTSSILHSALQKVLFNELYSFSFRCSDFELRSLFGGFSYPWFQFLLSVFPSAHVGYDWSRVSWGPVQSLPRVLLSRCGLCDTKQRKSCRTCRIHGSSPTNGASADLTGHDWISELFRWRMLWHMEMTKTHEEG